MERRLRTSEADRIIRIVAAVIWNADGEVLLVRKAQTEAFMQPGGKRSGDETDLETLTRELREELGCTVRAASARHLGRFEAPAANEPGWIVQAEVYDVEVTGAPAAHAEIAELLWVDPRATPAVALAPLTRDHVLPLVRQPRRP
jgi:8-oxo-dGTP diphosphatase